jgi:hypothetical protein
VVITVIDISGPFIEAYHPLEFNELTLGNTLTWSVNDNHSYNYTILLNGVSIQTANWTNAENVTYNIDGFALGTYNFTLYAFDGSGNNASLVTLIEIRDNDSPSFTSVPSIPVYAEGDTGINLHWYPNDKYPFNYTIYQDNIPIQSGNWTNEDSISINIDGLLKGDYNFTLLIFDVHNNTHTHILLLEVIDNTLPNISQGDNVTLIFGTSGNSQSWTASDTYPASYIVYANSTIHVPANSWTSGGPINVPLDGFSVGIYNITIIVFDESNNPRSDTIFLIILPIRTLVPSIDIVDIVHKGTSEAVSGQWLTNNSVSIASGTIMVKLHSDNEIIDQFTETTTVNGYYSFTLDYSSLGLGLYQWEVVFTKIGYESQIVSLPFRVDPQDIIIEVKHDSELVQGSNYQLNVSVMYDDHSTALHLNQYSELTGGVEGLDVTLMVSFINSAGDLDFYLLNATTDDQGFAEFTIPGDETSNIASLDSVQPIVSDDNFVFPFQEKDLSVVQILDAILPSETPVSSSFFESDVFTYILLGILILIGISVLSYLFQQWRHRRITKFEHELDDALDEINTVSSIRAILFYSSTNQSPFYEEQFTLFQTDAVLITGLIAAISSFLDELEKEKTRGFQMMEREAVSLTSHTTEISTMTVISHEKLSPSYLKKMEQAHKLVDGRYKSSILKPVVTISDFDLAIFRGIFEESGMKLHLLRGIKVDKSEIDTANNAKSYHEKRSNELLKRLLVFPQDQILKIDTLFAHLAAEGLSRREAAFTIILAYDTGILYNETI